MIKRLDSIVQPFLFQPNCYAERKDALKGVLK